MKKNKGLVVALCAISLAAVPLSVTLNSCGGGDTDKPVKQNYVTAWKVTVSQNGLKDKDDPTAPIDVYANETATVTGKATKNANNDSSFVGTFEYESSDESLMTVSLNGECSFTGVERGGEAQTVTLTITCTNVGEGVTKTKTVTFTVNPARTATGVVSYAAGSYYDKLEILGKLEDYAINNHLTGLTLFENGGKMVTSKRITIPTKNEQYIPGFGFGVLSDGDLNSNDGKNYGFDEKTGNVYEVTSSESWGSEYKDYYHSAIGTGATNLCYLDDQGSVTADLYGYISSGLYGTQLNDTKDGYEWVNLLAKDTSTMTGLLDANKTGNPIPVSLDNGYYDDDGTVDNSKVHELDPNSGSGMFSNYKIYVKTGEDGGVKYSTSSTNSQVAAFNNRNVTIDDYITAYKNILTKKNDYYRGADMTSLTSSGTLKGAFSYYQASGNGYNESAWKNVGLKKGKDANGEFLVFSLVNSSTPFYAKYNLSSNLVSPIPQDFLDLMSDDSGKPSYYLKGGDKWTNICDTYLSVGPYLCATFDPNGTAKAIIYQKNDNYQAVQPGKYKNIPGIYMTMLDSSSDSDLYVKQFKLGYLDTASLTKNTLNDTFGNGTKRETVGDSTFKLNINSCNSETWEKLFGEKGSVYQNSKSSYWDVKPWMSNSNFLNAISFSINRKEYAESRGNNPSVAYFSDSYQWDPEGNEASEHNTSASYNQTSIHKDILTNFYGEDYTTTYGYDKEAAKLLFKRAINEMVSQGQITLPCNATININWMNTGEAKEYGTELKKYIEDACNDVSVSNGQFVLTVNNIDGTSQYTEVYNKMRQGQFDLAFGSISGNTLNPLEFLEVLKSDNSSGFTLNYGTDTSIPDSSLQYDGKVWSYDALWTASVKGAIIDDKGIVNSSPVTVTKRSSTVKGDYVVYTVLVDIVDTAVIELTNSGAIASIGYKEKASDTSSSTYTSLIDDDDFVITGPATGSKSAKLEIKVPASFTVDNSTKTEQITVNNKDYLSVEIMVNYNCTIESKGTMTTSSSTFSFRVK